MSTPYESFEVLGGHHPIEVQVTVAQAEERERRGIPLPISGDPTTDLSRELLEIRRHRTAEFPAADLTPHIEQLEVITTRFVEDMAKAAAPVVETGAAGLNFLIGRTQIRLAVLPMTGVGTVAALIDEETGQAAVLPLSKAVQVGNQLAKIGHALQNDDLELRGLGRPAVGIGQLRDRLGQFLDGRSEVTDISIIGVGSDAGDFGSVPGVVPGPVETHNSSPSVGAPDGAVRDNSKPTEGGPPATAGAGIDWAAVHAARERIAPIQRATFERQRALYEGRFPDPYPEMRERS